MTTNQHVVPSEWAPLRIAAFRAIWFASLAANVGTWFQNVGGVWLMTRFTASPLLIALMQTATTLPVFLVGFPAGARADIVNRRRLLLATQGLILITAATLSVLTFTGLMNAPLLLGFTFVLGLGAILANPAWQAVNAELVPSDELPAAVTLSSVSYNLARAVGPALAGLMIAVAGPAVVFLLNAIAFLYVVVVLFRWHPAPHRAVLPAERLVGAMRTGVRFVQNSPEMQTVLIRTFCFIFFISELWALLPVIVRQDLRLGAAGYGLLLGCLGVGAVLGAAVLPQIQRKIPVVDRQVIISTVALALVMIALGYLRNLPMLCLIATIGGTAWIMLVSCFNVAAQEASPVWVRAGTGRLPGRLPGRDRHRQPAMGCGCGSPGRSLCDAVGSARGRIGACRGTALALSGQRKAGSKTMACHGAQNAHRTSPARRSRHGAGRVLRRPAAGGGLSPRHARGAPHARKRRRFRVVCCTRPGT
jgi:MFS family permease